MPCDRFIHSKVEAYVKDFIPITVFVEVFLVSNVFHPDAKFR